MKKTPPGSLVALGSERRWVFYTGEPKGQRKIDKAPRRPRDGKPASTAKPADWGTLEEAREAARRMKRPGWSPGIGLVLGQLDCGLHLVGVDEDGCIDIHQRRIEPWAEEINRRICGYPEISPSNTGIKNFFLVKDTTAIRAAMGGQNKKTWHLGSHCGLELHLGNSYFTVTGNPFDEDFNTDDVVGLHGPLNVVPEDDVLWLINTAGPRLLGSAAGGRDESGSAYGFRFLIKCAARGMSKADALEALAEDDGPAGEWAGRAPERELARSWDNALAHAQSQRIDPNVEFDGDGVPVTAADPVTARLNESYALVRHRGKTLCVDFGRDGEINFGNVEDLHKWCANDLVPKAGRGLEPASRRWLGDPERRQYLDVVFDPSGKAPETSLNLWTGWGLKPDPGGSCTLILSHIHHVLANGDAKTARYILGWLAHLVQRPAVKPGVAMVLKGGKGAGKDTLAVIMSRIVGRAHVAHITRPELLTQRFNAHFERALLAHVEESFWAGSQADKGILQALITAPTTTSERKGIDPVVVDSFVRLMMTTNEDWAVPASADERRYAVFEVSGSRVGDRPYFDALYAEINGSGPAAFLHFLLNYDLSDFDVRDIPKTLALRDQKIASLRGFHRWWFDTLYEGDLQGDHFEACDWTSGCIHLERDFLRRRYDDFIQSQRHHGEAVDAARFGKLLREMMPEIRDIRPRGQGPDRPRMYLIPALQDCRAEFEAWLQSPVPWPKED